MVNQRAQRFCKVRLLEYFADVWGRALLPFNERPVSGSISLDPGASAVECVKWLVYGCVFAVASALSVVTVAPAQ